MAKSKTPRNPPVQGAHARIEQACAQAVDGKLALRQLASWVAGSGIGEAEFRVLWQLQVTAGTSAAAPAAMLDQADLAASLVASPAQISTVVERLRRGELAVCEPHPTDRRRQMWQLTPKGRALVLQVVAAVDASSEQSAKREAA